MRASSSSPSRTGGLRGALRLRAGFGGRAGRRALSLICVALLAPACAPRVRLALPDGAGTALADVQAASEAARESCLAPEALTADLRLSGRIAGDRVRGTLQVGVSRDSMRLEGLAPFGGPVFILAARPDEAVLLLPREDAFARADAAGRLLEAAVGVDLAPADLLAIISGCGLAEWTATGGETFQGGWTRLDAGDGQRLWLKAGGRGTAIVAAESGRWRVEYTRSGTGWPTRIRLVHAGPGTGRATDASFGIDAPESLNALPPAAFDLNIPPRAREVSLDDLRARRTLAER